MIKKYKLALIAAVASMGIASPAFAIELPFTYDAQGGRHFFAYGLSETATPDHNQTVGPQGSREQIATRQSGLHAFASVAGGYNSDGSYNRSGYDGGIETQR